MARYGMIAREIEGVRQAVATIEFETRGFTFETKDPILKALLNSYQKDGIFARVGSPASADGVIGDGGAAVRVNESTVGILEMDLLRNDYFYWEE